MRTLLKLTPLIILLTFVAIDTTAQRIVNTKYGQVAGQLLADVEIYRGIPYAAPPVGERRFKSPQAPDSWDTVFQAINDGPSAPHYIRPLGKLKLDNLTGTGWDKGDNYLTLTVWKPLEGEKFPVMVWIHGGAFTLGKKNVPVYDGINFARSGVICVTINYRLGMEGFMPIPGGETNLGLRDILFALKWIQENIGAFGGDPGNVTLFGESAGGTATSMLVASPLSKGLFKKAIAQSGSGTLIRSIAVASRITNKMADLLHVTPDLNGFRSTSFEKCVEAQRKLTKPGKLDLREANGVDPMAGITSFWPVYGDDVLPKPPMEMLREGAGKDIDFLMTTCAEEGNTFTIPTKLQRVPGIFLKSFLGKSMPKADVKSLLAGYRVGKISTGKAYTKALTDIGFRAPAREYAAAHLGRTHFFEFDWKSNAFKGKLGAGHAIDIPLVFNRTAVVQGEKEILGTLNASDEAGYIHALWVAFAKTGTLNWNEYTAENTEVFVESKRGTVKESKLYATKLLTQWGVN